MRIVFPYPNYWPYMRRGAERVIHDLSSYLADRGHEVHIITTKPGRPRTTRDGNVEITYLRQISHPLLFQYIPMVRLYHFGLLATRELLLGERRYDIAHLMSYSGIAFAPMLRRARNLPYVFQLIVREHWWPNSFDRFNFQQLFRSADRTVALTPNWAEHESAAYGMPVGVLPPPVDTSVFRPTGPKDLSRPIVLFPADLGDPRKGGLLLIRAWSEIHRRCPEARLVLAGPFGIVGSHPDANAYSALAQLHLVREPAARAAIEVRGPGTVGNLASLYSSAAVTVLPSVDEAFGMVVTESLACGTPVVCSADAGPAEIITSPEVGATVPLYHLTDLLDGTHAGELAEAVLYSIDLARRTQTQQRCVDWAQQWSLEEVGLATERLYTEILEERGQQRASLQPVLAGGVA